MILTCIIIAFFKSKNKSRVIFWLVLIACSMSASAQHRSLHYTLTNGDDSVGQLIVSDNTNQQGRSIHSSLNAQIQLLLFTIRLSDTKKTVFSNNVLQSAEVERKLFNKGRERNITEFKNNQYTDGSGVIPGLKGRSNINFSMAMLYTSEPRNGQWIYSEFHQQLVPVEKTGNHEYKIKTPDGQTGFYFYENGVCVKIITQTAWATINTVLTTTILSKK